MTHPLTDEMCEELSCFYLSNLGDTGEGIAQDMRSAADWQLEQVNKFFDDYCLTVDDLSQQVKLKRLLSLLNAAMRPQEDK